MTSTSDLWYATDRLTQPVPYHIERDNGTTQHVTLPPLLVQLEDAVTDGRGGHARGKQQSRPPLDTACLSLLIDITTTTMEFINEHRLERQPRLELDLRRVASRLVGLDDSDLTDWWTQAIRHWTGHIVGLISNDPDRPRAIRIPCPYCGVYRVRITDPHGMWLTTNAVYATWSKGLVRAVQCRACGMVAMRGQPLEDLADKILTQRERLGA